MMELPIRRVISLPPYLTEGKLFPQSSTVYLDACASLGLSPLITASLTQRSVSSLRNQIEIRARAANSNANDLAAYLAAKRKVDLARQHAQEHARKNDEFRKGLIVWKYEQKCIKTVLTLPRAEKKIYEMLAKESGVDRKDGEDITKWITRVRGINDKIGDIWDKVEDNARETMLVPQVWPHWDLVYSGLGECLGCYVVGILCDRTVVRRGFLKSPDEECGRCWRRGAGCVVWRGGRKDGDWELVKTPKGTNDLDEEERRRVKTQVVDELLSKVNEYEMLDVDGMLMDGVDKSRWAPKISACEADRKRLKQGQSALKSIDERV